MSSKKTFLSLALSLAAVYCCGSATAVQAQEAQEGRRVQTDGAQVFVFGGGNHLGVSVESVTRENMNSFNLREPRGVVVRDVAENSPAAKAGLQKNDVILRFDGEPVASVQKLQRLINESAPEHTARLSISRGGAERELSVTLGRRESFAPQAFGNFKFPDGQGFNFNADELKRNAEEWKKRAKEWERGSEDMRKSLEKFRADGFGNNFQLVYGAGSRRIGITTQVLTEQLANYFGVSQGQGGLLVSSVAENSPAARAGLKAGDVVTEVDGVRLKTAGELTRALNRKEEGDVSLTIVRERKTRTVKVTPDRTQNDPTFFTPGVELVAPMALIAPRVSLAPRPALPASPRLVPLSAPRPPAAPRRIYAVPAVPATPARPVTPPRPTTWVL